ncbi:restriction endonuclease [bacterium]|nr:restriction endonuclease [bacterium]
MKFWLWLLLALILFFSTAFLIKQEFSVKTVEAFLISFIIVGIIWIVGLRLIIGNKRPLSGKKLRNPHMATSEEFEQLCAEIYSHKGYKTELTPKGGDYGIDVIARKGKETIIIGAKRYAQNHSVSNRWVQQLLGAMHKCSADSSVLITTSKFTKNAIEQAKNAPIELIDGNDLKTIIHRLWL